MNKRSKILIVDDDAWSRQVLTKLLTMDGYDLVSASNGREALAKTAEFVPDLVLLDIMMPDMNGFEVCEQLRTQRKTAEIPIVVVTALRDQDSLIKSLKAGADEFISKPVNPTELRARVRTITRLNRYRRLLAERTKFERVVEHAEAGYVIVSREDTILFANTKARQYLGILENDDQTVPYSFLTQVQKQYNCKPSEAWTNWPNLHEEGGPRYLVRPESETAQSFWLQVETLEHLPEEIEPAWIISLRDVTAQMTIHQDIRKFHTMIYHKLRTPLNAIIGGLEIMSAKVESLTTEDVAKYAQMSLSEARQLHRHVEDIIRYMNAPMLAVAGMGVPLRQLPEMVQTISHELHLEQIEVQNQVVEHFETAKVQTILSAEAMEVILWALLDNAKKFHPQQQPIILVSLLPGSTSTEFMIQVKDNGITLSPAQLSKSWVPYYQGEKFFTGQVEGLGLGLPTVALLVWNVGGRCRIYNRDDEQGVVVEVILPITSR